MELISYQNQALAQKVTQEIIRNRNNGAPGKGKRTKNSKCMFMQFPTI